MTLQQRGQLARACVALHRCCGRLVECSVFRSMNVSQQEMLEKKNCKQEIPEQYRTQKKVQQNAETSLKFQNQ